MSEPADTTELLRAWHDGDREALDALLVRDLSWVQDYVRRELGDGLRRRAESGDVVQEAMCDALRYGPKFVVSDRAKFRALLARIVRNNLADLHKRNRCARRDVAREETLHSGVLDLDSSRLLGTAPDAKLEQQENRSWVRLALELLGPEDREVLLLREWDGLAFTEIAERMGVTDSQVRARFHRALPRLAKQVRALRSGTWDGFEASA